MSSCEPVQGPACCACFRWQGFFCSAHRDVAIAHSSRIAAEITVPVLSPRRRKGLRGADDLSMSSDLQADEAVSVQQPSADPQLLASVFDLMFPGEKLDSENAGRLAVRLHDLAAEASSLASRGDPHVRQAKRRKSGASYTANQALL